MQVHTTLTTDSGKLLSKLNTIQPEGKMNFLDSVRVSVLALKHRCGKNHKTRIVVFVGSPISDDPKEVNVLNCFLNSFICFRKRKNICLLLF